MKKVDNTPMLILNRTDGTAIAINPSRVTHVTPYMEDTSVVHFSKENYAIVQGDVHTVADALVRRATTQ